MSDNWDGRPAHWGPMIQRVDANDAREERQRIAEREERIQALADRDAIRAQAEGIERALYGHSAGDLLAERMRQAAASDDSPDSPGHNLNSWQPPEHFIGEHWQPLLPKQHPDDDITPAATRLARTQQARERHAAGREHMAHIISRLEQKHPGWQAYRPARDRFYSDADWGQEHEARYDAAVHYYDA